MGGVVLSLRGCQTPTQYLEKVCTRSWKTFSRLASVGGKSNKHKPRTFFWRPLRDNRHHGRNPHPSQGQRDKMAILMWNSTGNGRFVPGTGSGLSQRRAPFVPGPVPVSPEHRPAQEFLCLFWDPMQFFLREYKISPPRNLARPGPVLKIT